MKSSRNLFSTHARGKSETQAFSTRLVLPQKYVGFSDYTDICSWPVANVLLVFWFGNHLIKELMVWQAVTAKSRPVF